MKPNSKTILILLSLSYIAFMISDIMIVFFDFKSGVKTNSCISFFSNIMFLTFMWMMENKEDKKNEKVH